MCDEPIIVKHFISTLRYYYSGWFVQPSNWKHGRFQTLVSSNFQWTSQPRNVCIYQIHYIATTKYALWKWPHLTQGNAEVQVENLPNFHLFLSKTVIIFYQIVKIATKIRVIAQRFNDAKRRSLTWKTKDITLTWFNWKKIFLKHFENRCTIYSYFDFGLKTAVFGCLTNALAPPPIALESCSRAQMDQPV